MPEFTYRELNHQGREREACWLLSVLCNPLWQPFPLLGFAPTASWRSSSQQYTCEPQGTVASFLGASANPAELEPTAGEIMRANMGKRLAAILKVKHIHQRATEALACPKTHTYLLTTTLFEKDTNWIQLTNILTTKSQGEKTKSRQWDITLQ